MVDLVPHGLRACVEVARGGSDRRAMRCDVVDITCFALSRLFWNPPCVATACPVGRVEPANNRLESPNIRARGASSRKRAQKHGNVLFQTSQDTDAWTPASVSRTFNHSSGKHSSGRTGEGALINGQRNFICPALIW